MVVTAQYRDTYKYTTSPLLCVFKHVIYLYHIVIKSLSSSYDSS